MIPEVNYCVQKRPTQVPVLSQVIPVHIFLPISFNIRFNIILPRTSRPNLLDYFSSSDFSHSLPLFGRHIPRIVIINTMKHGFLLTRRYKSKSPHSTPCKCMAGVNIQGHSFLIYALDAAEWWNSRPRRSIPRKEPRDQLKKKLVGPQNRSVRFGEQKILLFLTEFEPQTVHPAAKYRLRYRCRLYIYIGKVHTRRGHDSPGGE